MANELSQSLSLSFAKNGVSLSSSISKQEDVTGANAISNVQTVGTSSEALLLGDVGNPPQVLMIRNLDPTNFVEIDDVSSFDDFPQKLLPGQFIVLRPQTATIYAKADTAACDIHVIATDS